MARILLVVTDSATRSTLSAALTGAGHEIAEAATPTAAPRLLASEAFDLILAEQSAAEADDAALLHAARDTDPTLPFVFVLPCATVESTTAAIRAGAFDFLTLPVDTESLGAVVERACEHARLLRENERLRGEVMRLACCGELVGSSTAIEKLREKIVRVAPTVATVLITGETGTGKELVARALHKNSPRAAEPFLAVNCAALTETLLESELFGHERGAFTGADRMRQGVFETAHRGTLFLDEAGEMSLPMQAKLLRVLTDGKVVRVGGSTPHQVDVRIVVATHRNLSERVREGTFREDLFYRIAVVPLHIPPLRERRGDIALLVNHFLGLVAADLKMSPRTIHPDAVAKLTAYDFPGNVRELRNLIERAYILAHDAEIGPDDLPLHELPRRPRTSAISTRAAVAPAAAPAGDASAPARTGFDACLEALPEDAELRATIETIERGLIERALRRARWVQAEAARLLGVSRSDLAYKIKKHDIQKSATS